MPSSPLWVFPFLALAYAGYYGLWVVGTNNGLMPYLEGACKPFGSGRSSYIGIKAVDDLLCILVTFFMDGLSYTPLKPYLTLFGSLFVVPLFLIQLASNEPGQNPLIKYSSLVTGLACQAFGAGVVLPVWYALFALFGRTRGSSPAAEVAGDKRNYFGAYLLGNILPGYAMIDPDGHVAKANLFSPRSLQNLTAAWQPFPLTIAILTPLLTSILPVNRRTSINCFKAVTTLMYYASLFSFYQMTQQHYGGDFIKALKATFLVPLKGGSNGQKAHLFLLFDGLSVWISSGLWAMTGRKEGVTLANVGSYLVASLVRGPGNAVIGMWETKEGKGKGKMQ